MAGEKKKKNNKAIALALAVISAGALVFGGCGSKKDEEQATEATRTSVSYVNSMDKLSNGEFAIEHKEKGKTVYYLPYSGNATFDKTSTASVANASRVLWFQDDFNAIPTMYEGDKLVYRYNESFNENFTFERFLDLGYTVGVANLKQRESGHYELSISSKSKTNSINPASDMTALKSLDGQTVTFETLGGSEIRNANVTSSGTIRGLKKGRQYKAEVYTGTEVNDFTFTADSRAMCSYQIYNSTDYTYKSSKIIEVTIPSFFNSGYYSINGSGLFRYVKGSSYDDDTDFSVLNVSPNSQGTQEQANEESALDNTSPQEDQDTKTEIIQIPADSNYVITINYDNAVSSEYLQDDDGNTIPISRIPAPTATLSNYEMTANFTNVSNQNSLTLNANKLSTGSYTLKIYGLKGRAYNYSVQDLKQSGN